jgi:formate dehydrogenase major subunit
MTGNCTALQSLADEPGYLQINSLDAAQFGIEDEALLWISSRRGKVLTRAQVTDRANQGTVYMTYQWWIGACNELTLEHVDPISKTPEYKYCAVKIEPIKDQVWAERYLEEEYSKLKRQLSEPVR